MLEKMISPLYTCTLAETSGIKLLQKERQKGHEAYVVARLCARFDFDMKLEDTTPAIVKVT
jgi:hypothetical protein